MLALSVRQPWAYAILYLGKRIENRSWQIAKERLKGELSGDICLHAGKAWGYAEKNDLALLRPTIERKIAKPYPPIYTGGLVGVMRIIDCQVPNDVDSEQDFWAIGDFCFALNQVRSFPQPIPYKGALGFFHVPDELVANQLSVAVTQ
jgi:hypothetical protein